ncbi:MAG: hypothetical protein V3U33_08155 [candidate division NC10 bacterium]
MSAPNPLLVAAKGRLLDPGSSIALVALLAYRRRGARLMEYSSIGLALVALGSSLEGLPIELVGRDLLSAHVLASISFPAIPSVLADVLRRRRFRL